VELSEGPQLRDSNKNERGAAGPVRRREAATQVAWERQMLAANKDTWGVHFRNDSEITSVAAAAAATTVKR
jgi:hypothetical protein